MSCKRQIYKGENGVIRWPLRDREGNPLDLASCELIKVSFLQDGKIKQAYTYGTDAQVDISGNVLIIEFSSAMTNALNKALTILKVELELMDSELLSDTIKNDQFETEVFIVR